MKKIIAAFVAVILAIGLCACGPRKTKYDDKKVVKITSTWWEGFAPFPRDFVRTFDFERGIVADAILADERYLEGTDLDWLNDEEKARYNRPEQIATFTGEQGEEFLKKLVSLGFYTWKDNYQTSEIICDGGSECVVVYFSDGTQKSTSIYYKNPPNYRKILGAFEETFGVHLYQGW